jgi:hypothetical protein
MNRTTRAALTIWTCLSMPSCTILTSFLVGDGPALRDFEATDGDYFPEFVMGFFAASSKYARQFPTLEQARAKVRLIEVKQLTMGSPSNNEANLSWSADGYYLGYETIEGGFRHIKLKNLVGNYSRKLKVVPKGRNNFLDGMVISSAHSYNAGLRWSKDSTRFAFMSNGGIGEYNIYVGAVGRNEEVVAKSSYKDGYATWSPTNNEMAFVSARSGNGDIYCLDVNSKTVGRLTDSKQVDIFPEWFPDGQGIVYSSGDSRNHSLQILLRKAGQWQKPKNLTLTRSDDLRPTISPDGKLVAFYTDGGRQGAKKDWHIAVVPLGTSRAFKTFETRRMIVAKGVIIDLNTGPAWSPDSKKIFFVKNDPTRFNPIQAYDLFSGRIYEFATATKMNRDILMSPLGILSFRAQVGVWDRVFLALTNQGRQLQTTDHLQSTIHYMKL